MRKYIVSLLFIVGISCILVGSTYSYFNYIFYSNNIGMQAGAVYLDIQNNTLDSISSNLVPETYTSAVYDINNNLRTDNIIEFQISALDVTNKAIDYDISLIYGNSYEGRYRIPDRYLRFNLSDITNPNEELFILKNMTFDNINDLPIHSDSFEKQSLDSNRVYRLRIWLSDEIRITDENIEKDFCITSACTNDPSLIFGNQFASVKLKVFGYLRER